MSQTNQTQQVPVSRVALTELPASHPFMTNPVPVGVAGFALTTFTLGLFTSGRVNPHGEVIVFGLALFYGGLTQFIAGWFAARRGDLFAGVFMTTYGAFWFSYVFLGLYALPRAGTAGPQMVTIFLIMWTVITAIFLLAALGTNWAVLLTFSEFVATLVVAILGSWRASVGLTHASGYLEMVLGAMAWYIVLAEVVNDNVKRPIFPLFPFKRPLIKPASVAPYYPAYDNPNG